MATSLQRILTVPACAGAVGFRRPRAFKPGFLPTKVHTRAEELIRQNERKLREHHDYVRAMSINPPEILNWRWQARPAVIETRINE